jgi:hypothetical protein
MLARGEDMEGISRFELNQQPNTTPSSGINIILVVSVIVQEKQLLSAASIPGIVFLFRFVLKVLIITGGVN